MLYTLNLPPPPFQRKEKKEKKEIMIIRIENRKKSSQKLIFSTFSIVPAQSALFYCSLDKSRNKSITLINKTNIEKW